MHGLGNDFVVVDATGGAHPPLPEVRWRPGHRVRLVGHGRRLDRAAAANLGLESVAGEFFGYLDDDDTCTPEHVSTLVRAALAHPEALAVYGRTRWLRPDGGLERLHGLPFFRARRYHGPTMCWQAALFRSSVIALGCRFRGELDGVEDRGKLLVIHLDERNGFQGGFQVGGALFDALFQYPVGFGESRAELDP